MSFRTLPCEDADMRRIVDITSLAFQRNEAMWDATFPQHWTEQGREKGARNFLEQKLSDPTVHYIKAVKDDENIIVGMTRWIILQNQFSPSEIQDEDPEDIKNAEDIAWFNDMIVSFMEMRDEAIAASNGNLVDLDVLAVDPEYQGQGAGGELIAWGVEKADELAVESVVESSMT